MERPSGHLFIGESIDPNTGDRSGTPILLDSADFTTHGVIVGMTGSGKTGLGVVLLEEALASGIPVLAIDPKGDLGNLCLTFPNLSEADFEPWVDPGTARVQQTTTAKLGAETAELWRDGLASWGLGSDDVAKLAEKADPVIYTPGSDAGIPMDVLGRLTAPATDDPSARQDEVDATVSGLLGLVGIESDPLSGREHILLANLITGAWDKGEDLDLPGLLGQLIDPPIRKLGVLDLDTFFPAKDRQALVMKLNGLLASPTFASWAQGAPLDIDKMLWSADGAARAAVVSLSHLEEAERHFAITLVLSKLISWMRTQAGTSELRVLVYIDEVMGLAPPVGNPPPKKPILTLLKQARAFGVGLVLSTQNPVDLDYKAISNAGTWMIGRLQTEQDKNRLVDGLKSADGGVDIGEVNEVISGLGKRQFMLRTTRSSALPVLTTRWAMSYLAGPLTRNQITRLMGEKLATELGPVARSTGQGTKQPSGQPAGATEPVGDNPGGDNPVGDNPVGDSKASPQPSPAASLADDESTVHPRVPDSLRVRYVAGATPWLRDLDAEPGGDRLRPALAVRVALLFDERAADLRHSDEWEAIVPITDDGFDVDSAIAVDFDDRDFSPQAPDSPIYVLPSSDISAGELRKLPTAIKSRLVAEQTLLLLRNRELQLWSRPGESPEAFALRCRDVADEAADKAAAKLRDKLERKQDSLEAALAKAQDRIAELETQASGRKQQQIVDIGSSILGGLLGGRSRTRGLATAARRYSSNRRQQDSVQARLETAENRLAEKIEDLEQLEIEIQDAIIEIDDEWADKAAMVEEVEVPLEKADINIDEPLLIWLPVRR